MRSKDIRVFALNNAHASTTPFPSRERGWAGGARGGRGGGETEQVGVVVGKVFHGEI